MRIVFMGTPDFAVPALRALLDAGHEIVAVYSQPPRAAGRGMALRASPVQQEAEQAGLAVRTPERLKSAEEQERFRALQADAAVVVAYGLILPKPILDGDPARRSSMSMPRCCRAGAAPPRSTAPSWPATGKPASRSCASPKASMPARSASRAAWPSAATRPPASCTTRLPAIGARLMVEALDRARAGSLDCRAQPTRASPMPHKIDPPRRASIGRDPAPEVHDMIRGLSPFPGAWFELELNGKRERDQGAALDARRRRRARRARCSTIV